MRLSAILTYAHRSKKTVDLLKRLTPDFIPPSLGPTNCADCNPVGYKILAAGVRNELHQMGPPGPARDWQRSQTVSVYRSAKGGHVPIWQYLLATWQL